MAETYREGVFLMLEGHMTETEKRPNTEPQGVPEALDRFFGKLLKFPGDLEVARSLNPTKMGCFGPRAASAEIGQEHSSYPYSSYPYPSYTFV